MNEDKKLKKGNGEQPEKETTDEGVEGYSYCDSHEARCSNDCGGSPFLSHLN